MNTILRPLFNIFKSDAVTQFMYFLLLICQSYNPKSSYSDSGTQTGEYTLHKVSPNFLAILRILR